MASFSPSPNSPPVSDPALPTMPLFPSPETSQSPPSSARSPLSPPSLSPQDLSPPSPPPSSTDPLPATVPPTSRPPVSSPPLDDTPPTSSPTPLTNSTPPSSPLPPTISPPPTSPPSTTSLTPPANPTMRSPPLPDFSPPLRNSPSIPPPPISSPPPSLVRAKKSPSIPSPPMLSPPPSSIRSSNSPSIPPPPILNPPPSSVPPRNIVNIPPPPILSPPPSSVPPRNSPSDPSSSRKSPSLGHPPRTNSSSPPRTLPYRGHATNSSSPPIITLPPHSTPSTNSSSPPVIVASLPPSRQLPPPSRNDSSNGGTNTTIVNPGNNVTSPNRPSSNGGIGTGGIVGISTVLGVILLATILTVLWCLIKRKKKIAGHNGLYDLSTSMGNSPRSNSGLLKIQTSSVESGNLSSNDFFYSAQEPGGLGNSRLKFTYEDLVDATNGFSQHNILGSGGFGYVYKGFLSDGTEVAVKELKTGSLQGEREFTAEVEIISRIHHRYLVSLVGYCISGNKRLLVYEFVSNNTLYHHLHVPEVVFDWPTRVRVASGAARGIAYLHEDCHPRVIHRDIKSSNILLDENFDARVSDFGLAKLAADMNTHVTTRVMGTFGYMAPEYASSGKLSEKSDVFSFGVVLLELITGRKPVDMSQSLGDEGLVEWARPLLSDALETEDFKLLVDPTLGMKFVPNEMFRMIEAAAACIRHAASKRPRMGQIVRAFENLETEDLSNGLRFGESEIYNSAQQRFQRFQRMEFDGQDYSTDFTTEASCTTDSKEM